MSENKFKCPKCGWEHGVGECLAPAPPSASTPPNKVLTEDRRCGDCRHFLGDAMTPPICRKKQMAVIADMRVSYLSSEGTCWLPAAPPSAPGAPLSPTIEEMSGLIDFGKVVDDDDLAELHKMRHQCCDPTHADLERELATLRIQWNSALKGEDEALRAARRLTGELAVALRQIEQLLTPAGRAAQGE